MRWCWSCITLRRAMTNRAHKLSRQYGATLGRYLARQREELLQRAYELGRQALGQGLGVLDMARIHQQAIGSRLANGLSGKPDARWSKAAEMFFMEALSPFEARHRGFREANARLQLLNDALERSNADLREEVSQRERTESALRHLSNQLLHLQEAEREHISRELHDEVGGSLAGLNMNLALFRKDGFAQSRSARKRIADAQRLLQETMETVHGFARDLRPAALDDLGLLPTLRSYLKRFAHRTGLRVFFQASPAAERLNSKQKTVLFRVAQESLTNVVRHARASRVDVAIEKGRSGVQMRISDDGRSFRVGDQLAVNGRSRLGLLGMQERVRLVNGRFTIKSAPGEGTTVHVEIPFRAPRAANPIPEGRSK